MVNIIKSCLFFDLFFKYSEGIEFIKILILCLILEKGIYDFRFYFIIKDIMEKIGKICVNYVCYIFMGEW